MLGDAALEAKMQAITKDLIAEVYKTAFKKNSLLNECEKGVDNVSRIWWGQAESLVGFLNGYEKAPEHPEYLEAVFGQWDYIKTNLVVPVTVQNGLGFG